MALLFKAVFVYVNGLSSDLMGALRLILVLFWKLICETFSYQLGDSQN